MQARGGLFGFTTHKVYPATLVTECAVGSYSTFSPLLRPIQASERYFLCGTVRRDDSRRRRLRVSPAGPELRSIAPCGVRTFLPQLAPRAILRSSRTGIILNQRDRFNKLKAQTAPEMSQRSQDRG